MSAYYNEFEPFAAAWLRELIKRGLIAPGDVDERSITEVSPDDLRGYTQCHFFAGLGGWSYALRLAGWSDDRPVWSGGLQHFIIIEYLAQLLIRRFQEVLRSQVVVNARKLSQLPRAA